MGLDVYLYKYEDYEKTKKLEDRYEKGSGKIWSAIDKKYEDMSQKEKDTCSKKCDELAASLGLGKYGEDEKNSKRIDKASKKYPEHIFKIGYFRSSYNEGGTNSVLNDMGLKDLYDIFEHEEEEYVFRPDWKKALEYVNENIEAFKAYMKTEHAKYEVVKVDNNIFSNIKDFPSNEREALNIFVKEIQNKEASFNWYANRNGQFITEGIDVHGLLYGRDTFASRIKGTDMPCVYVIYKHKNIEKQVSTIDDKIEHKLGDKEKIETTNCPGGKEWYLQALEIIKETIEYVLSKKDSNKYYLHWSG